jgi:uncharacterized protein
MKITLKVVAGAKKTFWKEDDSGIKVYLTAPAVDGRANKALIAFLSKRFHIPKTRVSIISGLQSRRKIVVFDGL